MSSEQERRAHEDENLDPITRHLAARDPEYDLHTERLVAPEEELLKNWLPHATPTDGPSPAP
ncbi:hypothetical protein ACL9RL_06495 [Plantibacter sp. Mn2098]|uniref:hypothetical protein n=1 Tax=Plantibacter sp. Mn2098 TaxID=3395266 RepID=UPI003BC6D631